MNIQGQLSIFGTAELNPAQQTIEFVPGFVLPVIATGDFVQPWQSLIWTNQFVDIPWSGLTGSLFSISSPGMLASFEFTSYSLSTLPFTPFVAIGEGCMHMTGFDTTCGKASMTSQIGNFPNEYGNWTALTFIADPIHVPAPMVADGFPALLLTLLFWGWWRVRHAHQ